MKTKLHIVLIFTLSLAGLILPQAVCWGATYYLDPVNGDISYDGSYDNPWSTLQEVFANGKIGNPVVGGDTILCRTGYHGEIIYANAHNSDYITIAAQPGHTPKLKHIRLSSSSKWIFRGLTISPEFAPVFTTYNGIVSIWNSNDIIIEDNNIFSVQDASNWTADNWTSLASTGILFINVNNLVIRNNTLKNLNFGMGGHVDNILIEHNKVEHLAGDGLQISGDNITIQNNTFKNFYQVNNNHDDGIQFYPGGNYNVTLRGNIIIHRDPDITKFLGDMQGIGCFDPPHYNWLVENNVVMVPHLHGIAIYGATDSTIINNIAFHPTPTYSTGVYIHTGGTGSNTVIRNNMANVIDTTGTNITADHNIDIDDYGPDVLFVDYQNHDMRHKEGSPAIDAGSGELAPDTDIEGNPRPYGIGYDIGAYEYTLLPRVVISAEPDKGYVPLTVVFTISEIELPNGDIVTYEWNFGDGTTSQEKEPSHIYTSPGEYTATLIVIDIQGYRGQDQTHITVLRKEKEFEELSTGCYNNVFNPTKGEEALIWVELPNQAHVKVDLYNTRGNRIRKLADEERDTETCKYYWDGKDDSGNFVGSGLYFVHIQVGDYKKTKKIVVVK